MEAGGLDGGLIQVTFHQLGAAEKKQHQGKLLEGRFRYRKRRNCLSIFASLEVDKPLYVVSTQGVVGLCATVQSYQPGLLHSSLIAKTTLPA